MNLSLIQFLLLYIIEEINISTTPNLSDTDIEEVIETMVNNPEETEIEETIEKVFIVLKPNHTAWDNLLKKNVNSSGKVNCSQMKSDLVQINTYIKQLEGFSSQKDWFRNEKLAYWINLYNTATLRLIVENYPVNSITDLNGGKPWHKKVVTVSGKNYSLNQIENDILRPKFNKPRIHFTVNCAAVSCPKLMNSALPQKN